MKYLRLIRLHHWLKNLLILFPLAMVQKLDPHVFAVGMAVAFGFSLCASSMYLTNDLLDRNNDRLHPLKKSRPLPAGEVSVKTVLTLIPVFCLAGLLVVLSADAHVFPLLVTYIAVNALYSIFFKRIRGLDILCLPGLYVLRIFIGAEIFHLTLPHWLLFSSILFFFSLACLKRYADLRHFLSEPYLKSDLPLLTIWGVSAGYLSFAWLGIHLISGDSLFRRLNDPGAVAVLTFCWLNYLWWAARKNLIHEEPLLYAAKNKVSWACGVLIVSSVLI